MKDDVVAALAALRPELQRRGITGAGLFGSVARGEAGPNSDIDIFVDIHPDSGMDLFDYIGVQHLISDDLSPRFRRKIDVISTQKLKPLVRASIDRDAIHAF